MILVKPPYLSSPTASNPSYTALETSSIVSLSCSAARNVIAARSGFSISFLSSYHHHVLTALALFSSLDVAQHHPLLNMHDPEDMESSPSLSKRSRTLTRPRACDLCRQKKSASSSCRTVLPTTDHHRSQMYAFMQSWCSAHEITSR